MEEVPKNFLQQVLAAFQVSMLFMKFCIDGTPQGFSQPTEDDNMPW